jgi:hypothetical protein
MRRAASIQDTRRRILEQGGEKLANIIQTPMPLSVFDSVAIILWLRGSVERSGDRSQRTWQLFSMTPPGQSSQGLRPDEKKMVFSLTADTASLSL